MSVEKRKITGHIKFILMLFALPIGLVSYQNHKAKTERTPASSHTHHEKFLPDDKAGWSAIKKAAKSNSTFGIQINQEILDYNPSTEVSRIRVLLKFESFIQSEEVNLSWKLPQGVTLLEGRVSEVFHAMNPGQTNEAELLIEGNVFETSAMFVEVSSLVNSTRLGAVESVELKKGLEAHLESEKPIDEQNSDKKNIFKAEPAKQYKLIF